ncbi:hypothetical protein LD08_04215 [Neisseria meningitidis]|nr:hypothetical protein LD08_04215 [Neisseria meningitidis]
MAVSFRRGLTVGIIKKTLYPCNRVCIITPLKLKQFPVPKCRTHLLCNPFEYRDAEAGGFAF